MTDREERVSACIFAHAFEDPRHDFDLVLFVAFTFVPGRDTRNENNEPERNGCNYKIG